jgi:hypothetical protein
MDTSQVITGKLFLTTSTAVFIITVILAVIGGLVIFLFLQNRQINRLKEAAKPKYGFLGKPLLPVLTAALLFGGFGVTFLAQQGPGTSVNEEAKVELKVKTEVLEFTDTQAIVAFSVTPSVDGVEWGLKPGDTIDIYWNITGPKNLSEYELGLSINKRGGFTKTLPRGNYKVTVNTVVAGKNRTKTVDMVL